MTWTVGFDLDMTLIDSRRGVARAIDVVAAEFGLELRGAELAERLGPPLGMILADGGAPEELIPELVGRYRELYPDVVAEVPAMDGAEAAVEAVVGAGGRVVVVTGPCSAEELEAAGAEVVLADLTGFPAWWAGFDGARGSARRCAHTRP